MKCDNYHDISFTKDNLAFYAELNNTFKHLIKAYYQAEVSGSYITRNIQG